MLIPAQTPNPVKTSTFDTCPLGLMAESPTRQSQPDTSGLTSPAAFLKPSTPVKNSHYTDIRDFEDGRRGKRPRLEPPQMTAAAAMAETLAQPQQQHTSLKTSPNPRSAVLGALMGVSPKAASKSPKAFAPTPATIVAATTTSEPLSVVAKNLQQAENTSGDSQAQTSPVSVSSLGTLGSMTAAPMIGQTVHSPSPMGEDMRHQTPQREISSQSTSPENDNKAYSYPPPLLQPHLQGDRRHMSLPNSGLRQGSPRSPAKKHRCPYCATEFTRHHNLKSHLLTHSQEKPYVCSTCQSRFRRLHDLKRHTKLHTGERNHICPKCGRKFARGDALARHNKGPGGCAGRRASLGSFNGDDDYDGNDDSMDGVVYNEPDTMVEEEGNEQRPGIKRHAPSGDDTPADNDQYSRIPSTYPPIQGRPPGGMAGGSFPPRANMSGQGSTASSAAATAGSSGPRPYHAPNGSISSLHPLPAPPANIFSQIPVSESPKPLSPGHSQQRQGTIDLQHARSPSLSSQFGGRPTGRTVSGASVHAAAGPQLPPPHGLNPPDPRFTLPSQGGPTHPPTQPIGPPTHMSGGGPLSSQSNSLSSHGQGSGENLGSAGIFGTREDRLWAYVKSLEQRLDGMASEITSLRAQLATAGGPAPPRPP